MIPRLKSDPLSTGPCSLTAGWVIWPCVLSQLSKRLRICDVRLFMQPHAETSTSNSEQSLLISYRVVSMKTTYIPYLSVEFTFSPSFCNPPPPTPTPTHTLLPCRLISNQFLSPAHKYSPERSWPFLSGGRQLGMRRRLRVRDELQIYPPRWLVTAPEKLFHL